MRENPCGVAFAACLVCGCGPAVGSSGGGGGDSDGGASTTGSASGTDDPGGPGSPTAVPPSTSPPPTTTTDEPVTGGSVDGSSSTGNPESGWVDEARSLYPTFRALFDDYLERTCAGFENVCHNNRELPVLVAAEDYLHAFDGRCREGGPTPPFDGCEPVGHSLEFVDGPDPGWQSEIGWLDVDLPADQLHVMLRDEAPAPGQTVTITIETGRVTEPWIAIEGAVANGSEIVAPLASLSQPQLESLAVDVLEGDPNRNGVFGADNPENLLLPGAPEDSYLFLRMTGELPGFPIPLAGEPPSSAQLGALGCWIQQVASPNASDLDAQIDYDTCSVELP